MLMLICACGREVEFPAEEGRYACSRCGRKHVLKWYNDRQWDAEIARRVKAGENAQWRAELRLTA
jgi:DNA-directed RNA polymerase subunit RPC12/RpoP